MSLLQRLVEWLSPPVAPPEGARQAEHQQAEAERLLRQLRAELSLLRRWRTDHAEDGQAIHDERLFWEQHGLPPEKHDDG